MTQHDARPAGGESGIGGSDWWGIFTSNELGYWLLRMSDWYEFFIKRPGHDTTSAKASALTMTMEEIESTKARSTTLMIGSGDDDAA